MTPFVYSGLSRPDGAIITPLSVNATLILIKIDFALSSDSEIMYLLILPIN